MSPKGRLKFWKLPLAGFDFWRDTGNSKFYPHIAEWACNYIEENLSFTTGEFAGKPFILEPWQRQLIGHLFGWINPDGTRRFRKLFLYIPRKNGKTELAAALGTMFFIADDEPTAEVYCGALTVKQANIFFKNVKSMIRRNPLLADRVKPPKGRTARALFDDITESSLHVLAADEDSTQGFNPHCAVIDEVHTLKDGSFPGALEEGMGSRRQPMLIMITTAADAGDNFCNSELDYAEKVRDNLTSDPSYMPIVFKAGEKDDPGKLETWKKANPNLDVSIKISFLERQYRKMSKTATGLARFKKYFLNLPTLKNSAWINIETWKECKAPFAEDQLLGQRCIISVDRSSVNDLSAVGMFFPDLQAYTCKFIVPRETAEENIAYDQWAKTGLINISEFSAIRDEELLELVDDIFLKYKIEKMTFDPWRMQRLADQIKEKHKIEVQPVAQSFKELSSVINDLEIAIRNKTLRHFSNPILEWMMLNVRVEKDHKENVKLVKENKDSPKKIDGVVAMVMAYKGAQAPAAPVSVYESQGLRTV